MERLTNEEVRVDESMDRYLGPRSVLEGMKPKLLDLVLNGPVLNSVSKAALRQIIRQLYSALAAYEDTGLEPECVEALKLSMMGKAIDSAEERLRLYRETGNTEWLVDLANFAMIEFMHPSHPQAHFRATGSDESPGLKNGISYKELMEEGDE